MASDISLYGRIDTGLVYQHTDIFGQNTDRFSLESGFVTGSRWGIKGTEDLGSFKVGFVLESGFSHDDGKSGQDSRLFGREAVVTIEGDFGKVYMGRIGSIVSDSGSLSVLGDASAFGNATNTLGGDLDNGYNIIVGGNYKMDVVTVFGKVAYFHNVKLSGDIGTIIAPKDTLNALGAGGYTLRGFGLELGAKVPVFGGNMLASLSYRDAEEVDYNHLSFKIYSANLGYDYAFSQRTNVYGAVGYLREKDSFFRAKGTGYQAAVGLIHKF